MPKKTEAAPADVSATEETTDVSPSEATGPAAPAEVATEETTDVSPSEATGPAVHTGTGEFAAPLTRELGQVRFECVESSSEGSALVAVLKPLHYSGRKTVELPSLTVRSQQKLFEVGQRFLVTVSPLALLLAVLLVLSPSRAVADTRTAPTRCTSCASTACYAAPCPGGRCGCRPVRRGAKWLGNKTRNGVRCLLGAPPIPYQPPPCGRGCCP